jgi:hypothetical protein
MKNPRLFRRLVFTFALLLLGGAQSACSLFRVQPDDSVQAEPGIDLSMTGFRYKIPLPQYSSSAIVAETPIQSDSATEVAREIPSGFTLQSFVEKIFYGGVKTKPAAPQDTQDVVSIKPPAAEVPVDLTNARQKSRFCARVNNRLSSITYQKCMDVNLESTGFYSAQGRPIMISRFAQLSGVSPTGRVLLIGGVHGDELSSVSIVFEWMEYLRVHHDGEFVWNVVPVMNPDGLFKQEPSRTNANGVDLNRNLPTSDWKNTALAYWRNKAGSAPRKFPGPAAGSEPETRWLMDEIDKFQPDMIITVHAPYNLIDYDAPSRKNAPRRFGLLKGGLLGTYPGSLGNYAGVKRGIPVVTIELPSSNKAMSVVQAHDMWSDMVEWLEITIPLENQRFSKSRYYVEAKK